VSATIEQRERPLSRAWVTSAEAAARRSTSRPARDRRTTRAPDPETTAAAASGRASAETECSPSRDRTARPRYPDPPQTKMLMALEAETGPRRRPRPITAPVIPYLEPPAHGEPPLRSVEEKLERVAAGRGMILLPLSATRVYTRPDIVYDAEPDEVLLAYEHTTDAITAFADAARSVAPAGGLPTPA
jgi:hypothetical protein